MSSVLVIDDNRGIRDTFRFLLKFAGYEVTVAADTASALAAATAVRFDVILIDLRLENESGLDVLRTLKDARCDARMVIVTAFPDPDAEQAAVVLGAAGFVAGLLELEEVIMVVAQAIEGPCPVHHPAEFIPPPVVARSDVAIDPRVDQVIRAIQCSPGATSLKVLAGQSAWSESRLRHVFTAWVGTPFSRFLNTARFAVVSRELIHSRRPIGGIAANAGWSDLRHFRKIFSTRFGMSPSAYRSRYGRNRAK